MENQLTGDLVAQVFKGREGWQIIIPNASQMKIRELASLMGRFKCNADEGADDTLVLSPLDPESPAPRAEEIATFYIHGIASVPRLRASPIFNKPRPTALGAA